MEKEIIFYPRTLGDWRNWLEKNHIKKRRVAVIRYKKHTGRNSPSPGDLMKEAICFGWIDTTVKRLDQDRYIINYVKRNENSKWSRNTLSYGKELLRMGKMSDQGLKFYKDGLGKPTHDHGIPDNPDVPDYLRTELDKDELAKKNFYLLSPSRRKMHLRWLLRAKQEDTKKRRVVEIIRIAKNGQ